MAIHDDAIVAMLGAIPRGSEWLSSSGDNHGLLNGAAAWVADEPRPFVRTSVINTDYPRTSFGGNLGMGVFSIACWFRLTPFSSGNGSILSFTTAGTVFGNLYIYTQSNSLSSFHTVNFHTSAGANFSGLSLAFNAWHFIGMSRDSDGVATTYVNRLTPKRGTSAMTQPVIDSISGLWSLNPTYQVPGDIADVSLWDRQLTNEEFATLADPSYLPLGGNVPTRHRIYSPYLIGDAG